MEYGLQLETLASDQFLIYESVLHAYSLQSAAYVPCLEL